MQTQTAAYPDGTRGAYTAAPAHKGVNMKKFRTQLRERIYPRWTPGMSTADYIQVYFGANTGNKPGHPHAYAGHLDHLTLYAPLPDSPAALYVGVDTVETVEGEE